MPFDVWFVVLTFLSPWAREVDQDSCWCRTCSTGYIYLEIGIYQVFVQFECLVLLWGYGHLALGVIVWDQSASLQIKTSKLHENIHFGFDSCNHLTFIVQSLHVFFPSMVCLVPESRPCGYYAAWMIKLLTAVKACLSRMYVFLFCFLEHPQGTFNFPIEGVGEDLIERLLKISVDPERNNSWFWEKQNETSKGGRWWQWRWS